MKLYIDTSKKDEISVFLNGEVFKTSSKKEKSQKLLPFIDEVLKKKRVGLKDLTEIGVNVGPGSFTGLKVGVSIAQTLGWVLDIPVNGKNLRKGEIIEIKYE